MSLFSSRCYQDANEDSEIRELSRKCRSLRYFISMIGVKIPNLTKHGF